MNPPTDFARRSAGPARWRRWARPIAIATVLLAILAAAPAARAWSGLSHRLITAEAVERLPQPLRDLLSKARGLERLQDASVAPDEWRRLEPGDAHYRPDEKPRHFFDVDALTDEAPPFEGLPRDLAALEERFGAEALDAHGRAPWAVVESLESLTQSLIDGPESHVFRHAGALAHYVADLHMPLHTTKNYDGRESGNPGIHRAVEVGLVHRYEAFYTEALGRGRRVVRYLPEARITPAVFDWIVDSHRRAADLLAADTDARRATDYDPSSEKGREEIADLTSERADPYYTTLKAELEKRGSPLAAGMREAAVHLADLLYTAWVDAGKPLSLGPQVPTGPEGRTMVDWVLPLVVAVVVFVLLSRRRRPQRPERPSE